MIASLNHVAAHSQKNGLSLRCLDCFQCHQTWQSHRSRNYRTYRTKPFFFSNFQLRLTFNFGDFCRFCTANRASRCRPPSPPPQPISPRREKEKKTSRCRLTRRKASSRLKGDFYSGSILRARGNAPVTSTYDTAARSRHFPRPLNRNRAKCSRSPCTAVYVKSVRRD